MTQKYEGRSSRTPTFRIKTRGYIEVKSLHRFKLWVPKRYSARPNQMIFSMLTLWSTGFVLASL